MLLHNQMVKVKWHGRNKQHFIDKGYIFTKLKDEFEVDVYELPEGSKVKIIFICDYCKGENQKKESDKVRTYQNHVNQSKKSLIKKDCCKHRECRSKQTSETRIKCVFKGNSLGDNFPDLVKEWSNKNAKTPWEYNYGSQQNVWWVCKNNSKHEWEAPVNRRTNMNSGCPFCRGLKIDMDNCLATLFPNIAKEWHPTKNRDKTPLTVGKCTGGKVWWQCEQGHEWKSNISDRTYGGNGCPDCGIKSKGVLRIKAFLNNEYTYELEKTFDNCKNKKKLPFDILIENKLIIEYDGKDHFEIINRSKTDLKRNIKNYESRIKNDSIKNHYCINNEIPLIRIPYWEFNNIEYILKEVFGYFKLKEKSNVDYLLVHKFLVNHPDWSSEEYLNQSNIYIKHLFKIN